MNIGRGFPTRPRISTQSSVAARIPSNQGKQGCPIPRPRARSSPSAGRRSVSLGHRRCSAGLDPDDSSRVNPIVRRALSGTIRSPPSASQRGGALAMEAVVRAAAIDDRFWSRALGVLVWLRQSEDAWAHTIRARGATFRFGRRFGLLAVVPTGRARRAGRVGVDPCGLVVARVTETMLSRPRRRRTRRSQRRTRAGCLPRRRTCGRR